MISVIMPVWNEKKYVATCLDSIKAQDINEKVEVIVVDGYSKDNTAEIAERYGARVIKQKPQGPSKAKNLGAKYAKGGIFIFTDADTIFPPDAFVKIKNHYKDKDIVAVGGPLVPTTRALIHRSMYFLTTDFVPTVCSFLRFYQFQGPNMSLRSDIFKKIKGFDEDLIMLEDNEIVNRAKKHGKVVWDRSLRLFNSPRRFEQQGYLRRTINFTRKQFDLYVLRKKDLGFKYTQTR